MSENLSYPPTRWPTGWLPVLRRGRTGIRGVVVGGNPFLIRGVCEYGFVVLLGGGFVFLFRDVSGQRSEMSMI